MKSFNLEIIIIFILGLLLYLKVVLSQRISEGCPSSKISEDIREFSLPPEQDCFTFEVLSIQKKHGAHLTLYFNSDSPTGLCPFVNDIKRVEFLVRGETSLVGYRYPVGEFSNPEAETYFCSDRNSSDYHRSVSSASQLGVNSQVSDCNRPTAKRLYYGRSVNIISFEISGGDSLTSLTGKGKDPKIIVACATWEYKPQEYPQVPKMFLDFTVEIELTSTTEEGSSVFLMGLYNVKLTLHRKLSNYCEQFIGGSTKIGTRDRVKTRPSEVIGVPSEMCTCFQRPMGEGQKKELYTDGHLPYCFEFNVFNQIDNSVCVIFGLKDCKSREGKEVVVEELVIMALNNKGYPYGRWKLAADKQCHVFTHDNYRTRRRTDIQTDEEMFKENIACATHGIKDNFLEPSLDKGEIPSVFYFWNNLMKGPVAVGVRFVQDKYFPDPLMRPKHLQFISEFVVKVDEDEPGEVYTMRTAKQLMVYNESTNEFIGMESLEMAGNIYMNGEYYEGLESDNCIPEPDPKDNDKPMDDHLCRCFKKARKSAEMSNDNHLTKQCFRLNYKPQKPFFFLITFEFLCEHEGFQIDEVAIQALSDKGVPFGKWEGVQRLQEKQACAKGKEFILRQGASPYKSQCSSMPSGVEAMHKKDDPPELFHYHNPNWGLGAGSKGRSGIPRVVAFCALWYYAKAARVFKGVTTEFQFVAETIVKHDGKEEMVVIRSDRYLFMLNETQNMENQIHTVGPSHLDNDVELKRDYYQQVQKIQCLETAPRPKKSELCKCFNKGKRTSSYNQTEIDVDDIKKCIKLTMVSGLNYSFTWHLHFDSDRCFGSFILYEVVLEAFNEFGIVNGYWSDGFSIKNEHWLPQACRWPMDEEAKIDFQKQFEGNELSFPPCDFAPWLEYLYFQRASKSSPSTMYHYRNSDELETVEDVCAKWDYPNENYNGPYPTQIQFYGQIRVIEKPLEETENRTRKSIIVDWRSDNYLLKNGTLEKNEPADYELKEDLDISLNNEYYIDITQKSPCLPLPREFKRVKNSTLVNSTETSNTTTPSNSSDIQ